MRASELTNEIRYALSIHPKQSGGSYNRALFVLNLAGRWLVTSKQGGWRFLAGATDTVSIDDTGRGLLPDDFKSLVSIVTATGYSRSLTTPEEVLEKRCGFAVFADTTDTGFKFHLLAPKDNPQDVEIIYERDWLDARQETDVIRMPDFMRPLLFRTCQVYAETMEGVEGRLPDVTKLEALKASSIYMDAAMADGSSQYEMGTYVPGTPYAGGHPIVTPVPLIPPPS